MPFEIIRDDITKVKADAIVNAANTGLKMGGGVCGAIFHAAGARELQAECDRIGGCATGQAVITKGYKLPAKYVIHTAGPVWQGGSRNEASLLADCYKNSLALAAENGCESIAFPLISSGIYGYPKDQALQIAVSSIGEFLLHNDMMVYLVVFDKKAVVLSGKLFASISSYIDDRYVEEHFYDRGRNQADESSGDNQAGVSASWAKASWSAAPGAADAETAGDVRDMSCHEETEDFSAAGPLAEDFSAAGSQSEETGSYDDENHFEGHDIRDMLVRQEKKYASHEYHAGADSVAETAAGYDGMFAKKKRSLEDVMSQLEEPFSKALIRLIDEKNRTDVETYKKANIDRKLFSKIRNDTEYRPSKPTAVALSIALELNLDETKDLLARAGYSLSHCSKSDLIIEYFIGQNNYNIHEINEALFAFDQDLLGTRYQ